KIRIKGNLPERVIVGQTTKFRYVLENTARLPAYNLCVRFSALPEAIEQVGGGHLITRLGPGETVEVTVAIRSRRRGYYRIKHPICRSSFPFNLFSFGTSPEDEETLIVLPPFSLLQISLRGLSQNVCAGGTRLVGQRRAFPEYVGNRPFLPGDSPRNTDARAWARLSVPATKEYHDDFDRCTALILDTCLPEVMSLSRSNESKELESAISLCASVAFTINNDCFIEFLLAGPELYQFTTWPKMMRLDKIHDILAGVEPSKSYSLETISPVLAGRFREISEVFFVLLRPNKAYRQLLELANQAGCHSTVLLIGGPSAVHVDEDDVGWTENVRFLSPDEILTMQIKRL
ncbi:MAG: DUF58 domain-containing protein, partial [Planctomycetes bacterium]|nr:DUF58 domain-containing protein [Planctomycetota bacterium]